MQYQSPLPLAVVTGAAHRIGRVIALDLSRRGFAIGLHYHSSEVQARSTFAEMVRMGVPVFLLQADLTAPDEIEAMFQKIAGLSHPLKVLVNSAAVMARSDLRTLPVEEWDFTLSLNLRAPWLCSRAAARLMEKAGGGVIVNISDCGAQKAWVNYAAYSVSKAGLEALTRLLARSLAPNVRVNAVAPGLILPSQDMPPEAWERLVDRLPLKMAGSSEDVARAVTYFIQNNYVTGQVLAVDGGYQII
jgi:NAD(P)-dependent dehydrogenase (short-subunit alcohol dehydrogenase family)